MSLCSLDTNILLYAANEDVAEHNICKGFLQKVIDDPADWIIADQVYLELYRALRSPKVMSYPMSAPQAASHISLLRDGMGLEHCGYATDCWDRLLGHLQAEDFPYRRTHDAVLAETLLSHGVRTFYTLNTKDFISAGFDRAINPVDSP